MKEKKSIKKNFFWQVGIEVTTMLLPLATSPVLARRMGAEALGIYSYVYTVTFYFYYFANLGMYQYGTRELAIVRDNNELLNKKFSELLSFQLLHGIFVTIVFLTYSVFISKYTDLMLIQTFYLIGAAVIQLNYLFSGLEDFKIMAIKTMLIRSAGVILIFIFIHSKDDLALYTMIMAAEPMIDALVLIVMARKKVKLVKVNLFDVFKHTRGLYLIFIPLMATFLYGTMDKLMLGNMSDMVQLGFYSNAEKALIAKKLAVSLSVVLVPRMSKLVGNSDKKKFIELLDKSIEVILLLNFAFGFGTAAVSSMFSVVFWGEGFTPCSILIQIMSFTLPAYGLTYVINNQYLVPLKKEKIYIRATILGAIVNFFMNLMLIPQFGALGASVATLATQYAVLIYECMAIRKSYSLLTSIKKTFPYLVFGIIMYSIVKAIDVRNDYSIVLLVLEVLSGATIFLVLCVSYWVIFKKVMYLDIIRRTFKRRRVCVNN